jgi:hypothetical protein
MLTLGMGGGLMNEAKMNFETRGGEGIFRE